MEQYVGLDVSQEQTSVCVVDGGSKVIWEGKCASTPEAIAATIRTRAPEAVRIGLESGPLSAWHWHELRKLSGKRKYSHTAWLMTSGGKR